MVTPSSSASRPKSTSILSESSRTTQTIPSEIPSPGQNNLENRATLITRVVGGTIGCVWFLLLLLGGGVLFHRRLTRTSSCQNRIDPPGGPQTSSAARIVAFLSPTPQPVHVTPYYQNNSARYANRIHKTGSNIPEEPPAYEYPCDLREVVHAFSAAGTSLRTHPVARNSVRSSLIQIDALLVNSSSQGTGTTISETLPPYAE